MHLCTANEAVAWQSKNYGGAGSEARPDVLLCSDLGGNNVDNKVKLQNATCS